MRLNSERRRIRSSFTGEERLKQDKMNSILYRRGEEKEFLKKKDE